MIFPIASLPCRILLVCCLSLCALSIANAAPFQEPAAPAGVQAGNTSLPQPEGTVEQQVTPVPNQPVEGERAPAVTTGALSFHDAVLTEDMTWRGQIVIVGTVTVAPQATLTIEPGAIIRFDADGGRGDGSGVLLVQGRLVAKGTLARPIIFTSAYAEPKAGDWQGIIFLGSEKKNSLEQCNLKGAKVGIDASFSSVTIRNLIVSLSDTALRCQDCLVTVNGSEFRDSTTGIHLMDSEADLRDIVLKNNRQGLLATRTSLFLSGSSFDRNSAAAVRGESSRLTITTSAFSDNGAGVVLSDCDGSVAINRIVNNGGHGIHLLRSRVKVNGNTIEHNAGNGIHVEDGAGIAWGNTITANGGYDCFNAGREDFRAVGNWWGGTNREAVGKRIYDRTVDAGRGKVHYLPLLTVRPPKAP